MINNYLEFYYNITDLNIQFFTKEHIIYYHSGPIPLSFLKVLNIGELIIKKKFSSRVMNLKSSSGLRFLCTKMEDGVIALGPFILDSDKPPNIGRSYSNSVEIPILSTEKLNAFSQLFELSKDSNVNFNATTEILEIHNPVFDENIKIDNKEIDLIYSIEKKIRNFIINGDSDGVKKIIENINTNNFKERLPNNPLRLQKNLAIILNTISRLSAEKGGLPNFLLHNISEKFAYKIEATNTIEGIDKLQIEMLLNYCEAVNNYGIKNHSYKIVKTCNFIILNLHHKLSLSDIANNVNSNAVYLSRLFKKEMGVTITEFIMDKRIMEARWMLGNSKDSITEIALKIGFEDVNYFSKVFLKKMGITPSEYKKSLWKNDFNGIP